MPATSFWDFSLPLGHDEAMMEDGRWMFKGSLKGGEGGLANGLAIFSETNSWVWVAFPFESAIYLTAPPRRSFKQQPWPEPETLQRKCSQFFFASFFFFWGKTPVTPFYFPFFIWFLLAWLYSGPIFGGWALFVVSLPRSVLFFRFLVEEMWLLLRQFVYPQIVINYSGQMQGPDSSNWSKRCPFHFCFWFG